MTAVDTEIAVLKTEMSQVKEEIQILKQDVKEIGVKVDTLAVDVAKWVGIITGIGIIANVIIAFFIAKIV